MSNISPLSFAFLFPICVTVLPISSSIFPSDVRVLVRSAQQLPFAPEVELPDTVRPLLNVTCRAGNSEDTTPALQLELLAQQPAGVYAWEMMGRNPAETKVGSWTFEILEPWI